MERKVRDYSRRKLALVVMIWVLSTVVIGTLLFFTFGWLDAAVFMVMSAGWGTYILLVIARRGAEGLRSYWLAYSRSDAEKGGWYKRYGPLAGILVASLSVAFGLLVKTSIVYEQWFPYVTLSFILVVLFLGCVMVAALMKTYGKWMIMIVVVPVLIALLYNWILRLLP